MLLSDPVVGDNVQICRAHEVLQQHIDAMVDVHLAHERHRSVGVVVVEMNLLAEVVETVDLVEDVDLGNHIAIGFSVTPLVGKPGERWTESSQA